MTDASPDSLTRPFWEAAAQHRLVRPVCDSCGTNFFTPQIACPRCHGESWSWQRSSGQGVVYSQSTVHRAPGPEFAVPYVLAIVALDEGWHMLSNIVHCPHESVRIGMRVRVAFPHAVGEPGPPMFEPAKGAAS